MGDDELLERYLVEVADTPVLTIAEEQALAGRAVGGDEDAGVQLVRASLRLVVALARRYTATGVPLLDLIQEGNLALVSAVERFEPQKGFAFRSYATWCIRRAMADAIRQPDVNTALVSLQDAWDTFVAHAGRQPSLDELVTESGMSLEEIVDLLGQPPTS